MAAFPFATVAFDLDGTLVDTSLDLAAALNRALDRQGRPALPAGTVKGFVGRGARVLVERALRASGEAPETLVDEALGLFLDRYADRVCVHSRPYSGIEDALEHLAQEGVRLAVCTNKPERLAHRLFDALGWTGRFAAIVGGDTLTARKPDPRPLAEALARAGGGPGAFVGDTAIDAATAAAAEIPFVGVDFGFAAFPDRIPPDAVRIDRWSELFPALKRVASKSSPRARTTVRR